MDLLAFTIALLFTVVLFIVKRKHLWAVTSAITVVIGAVTGFWAVTVLSGAGECTRLLATVAGNPLIIRIDTLSAFFILVVNFTALTGILYSGKYLATYGDRKSETEFRFHYFNLVWLYISMLLVTMFREFLPFLIAWELMSISSFFLVMFEGEIGDVLKAGIKYLVQMHIGFFFLLTAMLLLSAGPAGISSFDGMTGWFASHSGFPFFLLFFAGFGIKAGFIPLHSWLPLAHPAAPSHVSGIMSGVMIKMGIYGILRIILPMGNDFLKIGSVLLGFSILSGLLGVLYAIAQHDMKKLLAYHSIENIGIIGMGIGGGLIGLATGNNLLAFLAFTGGILHILNHSLFKSLLFFSAGSVYSKIHTRNMESMGGLLKKMPYTGLLFLIGAMAISGLPPFNGFISEFLIYSGFFQALNTGHSLLNVPALSSIVSLALIGGLALFCFAKAFAVIFLGSARSERTETAAEPGLSTNIILSLIALLIVGIGLFPFVFIKLAGSVSTLFIPIQPDLSGIGGVFTGVSHTSLIFLIITGLLLFVRFFQQKKVPVRTESTWGCGYSGADPAVHQYTATSFADNLTGLINPVIAVEKHYDPIEKDEIFPDERTFTTHGGDLFDHRIFSPAVSFILKVMKKLALFQSGKVQHYILYAFVFMALILILAVMGVFK